MARFTDENDGKSKVTEHVDYRNNMNWIGKFIRNYNDVYAGAPMQIYLRQCTDNEHYYIVIEYTLRMPDQEVGKTIWANPVSPNQSYEDFHKEFKHTYMRYKTVVKKYKGSKVMNDFFASIPNKNALIESTIRAPLNQ